MYQGDYANSENTYARTLHHSRVLKQKDFHIRGRVMKGGVSERIRTRDAAARQQLAVRHVVLCKYTRIIALILSVSYMYM